MITIDVGYKSLVMNKEDAMLLIGILERSEVYENKYHSETERKAKGMTEQYTYHIYPNESQYSMKIISDDMYKMAKLAGKPVKD